MSAAASAVFDGVVKQAPLATKNVTVIRVKTAREARDFIPDTPNSATFLNGLNAKWSGIGWLDLGVYTDARGVRSYAVNLSGRADLAMHLPGVEPHEVALIRKIQLRSNDLQLIIQEAGKTPDLIVDGVVTEMKSLFPGGDFRVRLAAANEQVLDYTRRHHLAPGAAAIDLISRDAVPVVELLAAINDYVRTGAPIGLASVSVYAGEDRQFFVRGKDGLFDLKDSPRSTAGDAKTSMPLARTSARFRVPDALGLAAVPDLNIIAHEATEPAKRLRAAGVKATVTVYGSARILPAAAARAALDALIEKFRNKSKRPKERALLYAARNAVEASKYYEIARKFGRLVAENGGGEVAVVTGGGPGIMEAANRGAFEAGGPSVGYNIILENEQALNQFVTPGLEFEFQYFAMRKMALRHGTMGLVYFPGGFGTMDELFDVLTLMRAGKMPRAPIVLIGEKSYWDNIFDFKEFARMGLISPGDLSLVRFSDTAEGAWREIIAGPSSR